MHRALFDDDDKNQKLNAETFSISRNLIQRKHESIGGGINNMEISTMFDVNAKAFSKVSNNSIATLTTSATNNSNSDIVENFNDFATANNKITLKKRTEKLNKDNAQSFLDSIKSIFKCSAGKVGSTKINEQTQLDYPLNLHLRMNEIFSMHDKLSDIAEHFNDLYSVGMLAVVCISGLISKRCHIEK